jgi:hypothetical protein
MQTKPSNRKPSASKAKPQTGANSNKGWEWAPFTKKAVDFNRAAKDLSDSLKSVYGDNLSISQFEKFVGAVPSMTEAQRGSLYVDRHSVDLFKIYRDARSARDAERDIFRGDKAIGDVDTGLEALTSSWFSEGDSESEEEEEEFPYEAC